MSALVSYREYPGGPTKSMFHSYYRDTCDAYLVEEYLSNMVQGGYVPVLTTLAGN